MTAVFKTPEVQGQYDLRYYAEHCECGWGPGSYNSLGHLWRPKMSKFKRLTVFWILGQWLWLAKDLSRLIVIRATGLYEMPHSQFVAGFWSVQHRTHRPTPTRASAVAGGHRLKDACSQLGDTFCFCGRCSGPLLAIRVVNIKPAALLRGSWRLLVVLIIHCPPSTILNAVVGRLGDSFQAHRPILTSDSAVVAGDRFIKAHNSFSGMVISNVFVQGATE